MITVGMATQTLSDGKEQSSSPQMLGNPPPLVTFAIFAYNQEHCVREAVEAAFAQTYSNLEIILSDDGSADSTFEIIKELALSFNGHHTIICRRSEPNGGLACHVNEVLSIAKGQFIVMAAGDDVSEPNRTDRLVEERLKYDSKPACVYSDFATINAESRVVRDRFCHLDYSSRTLSDFMDQPFALMCSYAFDVEVFRQFGKLNAALKNEDFIFPFRALLLDGRIVYVDEPLVRYRISDGHKQHERIFPAKAKLLQDHLRASALAEQFISDLEKSNYKRVHLDRLLKRRRDLTTSIALLSSGPLDTVLQLVSGLFGQPRTTLKLCRSWLAIAAPRLRGVWQLYRNLIGRKS